MTKTVQYGFVEGGKLHLVNKKRFISDIAQFKDVDVQIIIKKRGKRSLPQNAYYFGVVIQEIRLNLLERGYNFDSDTIHEYLKQKFNYEVLVIDETGERLEIGQTTTEMNKAEFSGYIDRITEWAAQTLELVIPLPETQLQMDFSQYHQQ